MMKKNKTVITLILSIILFFSHCKKENVPSSPHGIFFYPESALINNNLINSGVLIYNSTISFTSYNSFQTPSGVGYSQLARLIKYDINNQSVTNITDINHDTVKSISGALSIDANKYVGYNYDHHKNTILNGVSHVPLSLLLMDGKFNILKEVSIPEGSSYGLNIRLLSLENGTYLLITSQSFNSSQNTMVCFDAELNIKWKTNVENTTILTDDYTIKDILVKNNSIYLLQNRIRDKYNYDYYRIKQYSLAGEFINASVDSKLGYEGAKFISTEKGYAIIGYSFNAATDKKTFVTSFDLNNTINQTSVLAPIKLNNINGSTTGYTYVVSNVISCNNAYYFMTFENNLVKLNSSFEIEWMKQIDKFNNASSSKYITNIGNNIFAIGKSNWTGIDGITFVKMDLEGNPVQ